jgi:hypothetical protein
MHIGAIVIVVIAGIGCYHCLVYGSTVPASYRLQAYRHNHSVGGSQAYRRDHSVDSPGDFVPQSSYNSVSVGVVPHR